MSNHPGKVLIELDRAMAEFLLKNCETNIIMGLQTIDPVRPIITSPDLVAKTVELIENFKNVLTATKEALKE